MDEQQREEIATFRWSLIAPVLTQNLSPSERQRLLREIAGHPHEIPSSDKTRVGLRTLQRWVQAYRQHGFEGLKPHTRADADQGRAVPPEVLEAAIALRRAVPERSVQQIIALLELDGKVAPGRLKRTTLGRYLARAGCTRQQLRSKAARSLLRRFEAQHRNDLWQGDVLHALSLPVPGQPGKRRQVYLMAFLDDHSRVVYGQMYFEEKLPRLEDCLKRTILRYGLPRQIYVDNGAIYSTRHLARICAKLGIRLSHSRPYRPQGRGKVEKFFQYVRRSFVPEAHALVEAGQLRTLDELNEFFWAWLEVAYLSRPHGSTHQTPRQRFEADTEPLRRIDPTALREVFLWEEQRVVDKTGCFSLHGNRYEVDAALSGHRVLLRYDPYDLSQIQVWHEGRRFPDAAPLQLRRTHHHAVPAPAQPPSSDGRNFLTLARKHHEAEKQRRLGQTSYARLVGHKDGEPPR